MILEPNVKEKLLQLRKKAIEAGQMEARYLSERDALLLLARALPETNSILLAEQLKQDLKYMSLFDALALWCDPIQGLASRFPSQILQVATAILPVETK